MTLVIYYFLFQLFGKKNYIYIYIILIINTILLLFCFFVDYLNVTSYLFFLLSHSLYLNLLMFAYIFPSLYSTREISMCIINKQIYNWHKNSLGEQFNCMICSSNKLIFNFYSLNGLIFVKNNTLV